MIEETEIRSFEDLRDRVENRIQNIRDCAFRGQSDSAWKLESTLNRLIVHARQTGAKQASVETFVTMH
jgi:hypothetical protein